MKLSVKILLAFSIVLLLSVTDSASNYILSIKVEENTAFLNRSQEIIRNSARLHKQVIEMQSSFRGYLLTGDTNFLAGFKKGISDVPLLFLEQRTLIKDNAQQSAILYLIESIHLSWIAYAKELINARKQIAQSESSVNLYNDLLENKLKRQLGKKLNDEIDLKFAEFDRIEYQVRSIRSDKLTSSIQQTHTISLVFIALTIAIGIASTVYIISTISNRIKTMVQFAGSISDGRFGFMEDKKRDELTTLSTSLNIMSQNLKKTINELEKQNVELDKFAYVVSHDLKTPVRGIHNVVSWIEEDLLHELSPEMKNYLSIITQRTERMEGLINGLLAYGRTRQKMIPETVNVKEMVSEISAVIVPRHFKIEIGPLPNLSTERLKLEQVFSNLISNAVKYTPHTTGLINISYTEMPHHYAFSVRDNGIGIEQEYHNKIFEIFQTLREKDEKESTGIGLAIIKKILDDQHCTITVNSVPGKGTEFVFTWPKES